MTRQTKKQYELNQFKHSKRILLISFETNSNLHVPKEIMKEESKLF